MCGKKAIEEAGFRVTTVQEFLGLTDEENRIVETQVALARRTRELREALARRTRELREESWLTQEELASVLKSSQSRVAKIESGAPGVSLDLMFRGYFALGGQVADLVPQPARRVEKVKAKAPKAPAKARLGKTANGLAGGGKR